MTAFLDSNILIYAVGPRPELRDKQSLALKILEQPDCVFSAQVVNEFVWQVTHPRRPDRLTMKTARGLIGSWRRFRFVALDENVINRAWDVAARTNYSWWDCLIVAAATSARCDVLLTEDMQHGHVIDGVRIENPFRDLA